MPWSAGNATGNLLCAGASNNTSYACTNSIARAPNSLHSCMRHGPPTCNMYCVSPRQWQGCHAPHSWVCWNPLSSGSAILLESIRTPCALDCELCTGHTSSWGRPLDLCELMAVCQSDKTTATQSLCKAARNTRKTHHDEVRCKDERHDLPIVEMRWPTMGKQP